MVLIRRTAFKFWINRELQEATLSLTRAFASVKDRTNQNKIDKWNFDNHFKKAKPGIFAKTEFLNNFHDTLNLSAKHRGNNFIFLVFTELVAHKEAFLKIVKILFRLRLWYRYDVALDLRLKRSLHSHFAYKTCTKSFILRRVTWQNEWTKSKYSLLLRARNWEALSNWCIFFWQNVDEKAYVQNYDFSREAFHH